MAEFTGIPYAKTALISAIPAIMCFLTVYSYVHPTGMPLPVVHMILICYSIDSDVSPPIAVCAAAAAEIAKERRSCTAEKPQLAVS